MKARFYIQRRALPLLLGLVLCLGLVPTAFAAQQNSYHDPAAHWQESNNRTNELDVNSVVTNETFTCAECGTTAIFEVFRVPEYTRDGQTALSRNVKYSDGMSVDGETQGTILDGTPGVDAYYTGYHWTKAVCESCGSFNTNLGATNYGCYKNVYWLYDCASNFFEELPETVRYEYADSRYHTVITTGGSYCGFCYGTWHTEESCLERHELETEIEPQPANGRFAEVEHCTLCEYSRYDYTAAKAVIADYYGVVDGQPHTITVTDLSADAKGAPVALLSRKQAQEDAITALEALLRPGSVVTGRIVGMEPFGAFVDIGRGIVALLPTAYISAARIRHPRERFQIGQKILAVVKSLDRVSHRITLTHRELLGTWLENASLFAPGDTVQGIVRGIQDYGAFIELTPNLSGLTDRRDDLHEGDAVSVNIRSLRPERMKVKLQVIERLPPLPAPEPLRYWITDGVLERWVYSPANFEGEAAETVFTPVP